MIDLLEPPTPEEVLGAYQDMMTSNGGVAPALLSMGMIDGTGGTIPLASLGGDHPSDSLGRMVAIMEIEPPPDEARPVWVVVCADSYYTGINDVDPPPGETREQKAERLGIGRGSLAERFEVGMSGVSEAIIASMAHQDGRSWTAVQKYSRNSPFGVDVLVWQSIEMLSDSTRHPQGDIPELLAAIVKQKVDHA